MTKDLIDINKRAAERHPAGRFSISAANADRLVELQAENARLRDALERIARENRNCASDSNSMALCILSTEAHARAALNEGGTDE